MTLRRGITMLLVGLLFSAQAAAQQDRNSREGRAAGENPTARFRGGAHLQDSVEIVSNVSRDGRAATVIFRNLYSEVGGVRGGALVKHRVSSVELLVRPAAQPVPVTQTIRGYVEADEAARAVLVVQMLGETHLVDLAEAAERHDDFEFTAEGTLPAGGEQYMATFFLLTERDSELARVAAYLEVTTLDLEFEQAQ